MTGKAMRVAWFDADYALVQRLVKSRLSRGGYA